MFTIPLVTSSSQVPLENFWNGVMLYHKSPHLVNRRLSGTILTTLARVDFANDDIKRVSELFTRSAILYEIRKLKKLSKENLTKEVLCRILETYDKEVYIEDRPIQDFLNAEEGVYISLKILLPRQQCYDACVEVAILDKRNTVATFFAVTELNKKSLAPPFPYDIEYSAEENLRICVQDFEHAESSAAEWLSDHLFPKLIKWIENYDSSLASSQSLSLISVEEYTELYHILKNKYGKKLVENWTERTDPLKFVFEDIAIATYLISLWKTIHPTSKPRFVDVGCGNGLLVYILNQEGFPGYGIDIRKRKIWDWYPESTILKVHTLTPSASSLFPESDWIIGNHSDELTPWIPIITARSSYQANFFLLPCCCYDFNGQKYRRVNSKISMYSEYLTYVEAICKTCQFSTKIDKLRIPSTKRTCIVSFGRLYKSEQCVEVDKCISKLINEKCPSATKTNLNHATWTSNFKPRAEDLNPRNCTQLSKTLISEIVSKISAYLLEKENFITKSDGDMWNVGGSIPLPELVRLLGKDTLKELKNEFGGLQTLLKNHRYIFEVSKAMVSFRVPSTMKISGTKYKNKPCWFHNYHPKGCFNGTDTCCYQH